MNVSFSNFENNTANEGGAVYIRSNTEKTKKSLISDTKFNDNKATMATAIFLAETYLELHNIYTNKQFGVDSVLCDKSTIVVDSSNPTFTSIQCSHCNVVGGKICAVSHRWIGAVVGVVSALVIVTSVGVGYYLHKKKSSGDGYEKIQN